MAGRASRVYNYCHSFPNSPNCPWPVYNNQPLIPPDGNNCGIYSNGKISADIRIDNSGNVIMYYTDNLVTTLKRGQLNIDKNSFVVFDNTFIPSNIGAYNGTFTSTTTFLFQSINNLGTAEPGIILYKKTSSQSPINPLIPLNGPVNLTNNVIYSHRNTPYIELIYTSNDSSNNTIYTNSNFIQGFTTSSTATLDLKPILILDSSNIILNDRRFAAYDLNVKININITPTEEFPEYKYLPFNLNLNNDPSYNQTTFVNITFELANISTAGSGGAYKEDITYRQNKWVYYPSTLVYYLANVNDINNIKIYVMQTYCTRVKHDLNSTNLCYIADSLITLPSGWFFSFMLLDDYTYLTVNCYGTAILVTDDLINTYEYVFPETAPFLYNKIRNQIL